MAEDKKKWYVLRTISGKEMKVKEILEATCKNREDLAACISQVLVPTEKVYVTRAGGKKVLKDKVLFSGYVYVNAELKGEIEDLLRNTTNVIDFIRGRDTARKPVVIREEEIARMVGAGSDGEQEEIVASDDNFLVGESVKVTFGPFSGFTGEIEEVNREKRKLTVMVKVFGRKTPLVLENSQVERE